MEAGSDRYGVKVTTQEIAGRTVEIRVSTRGRFYVVHGDLSLGTGDTFEQAIHAARRQAAKNKVRVSVEFVSLGGERGVATARHARNRTLLTSLGEEGARLTAFRTEIPDDVLASYLSADQRQREANREMRSIEREWTFDVGPAVDRAIEEASA